MPHLFKALTLSVLAAAPMSPRAAAPGVEDLLTAARQRYAALTDYTCLFSKKELVGGKLVERNNIIYKFKKPFSVYMKWTEGPESGTEAIYAGERYKYKIKAHGGKFNFITLSLEPAGKIAMRRNRHTILDSPVGSVLDLIWKDYQAACRNGEGRIEYAGEQNVDGLRTYLVIAELPETPAYYAHRVYINFDETLHLPVRIAVYGWKDELLEKYEYKQLRLDTGLTDEDFDVKNPAYRF